jgi:amino acid adenylation domain-containing protein
VSGTSGKANELSARKRALLDLLLREEQVADGRESRIPRRAVLTPAPQSFAQRRLWMLEALRPGTPIYTIRTALRLTGSVDCDVLERSVNELVRRHEALRTTFTMHDGEPIQVVAPSLALKLAVIDAEGATVQDREAAARRCADEEASRPFDLEKGPLFRACLFRLGPGDHVLLLTLHHIVADGWSLGVLLRDLSAVYISFARGEPSPLPEPLIQYADYAIWQQNVVATRAFREQLAYWTGQLANLPNLALPTDRPRRAMPGLAGERQHLILSRQATEGLTALGQREGATLFMTVLAAFQVVLARWSGQDDFGIGTPIANRNRAETEDVVGFFLNTLVMRADLRGDPTFATLLARVRETTLAAYARQDLPFERLLEALRPARDPSRTPLFQVFFNLLNFADERLNRPAAVADAPTQDDFAQFDLTLYAGEHERRLQLQLVYRTDLFDAATARRLLGYLNTLLCEVAGNADRHVSVLPLVPPEERRRLKERRNIVRPERAFERFEPEDIEQSVSARFAEQVTKHPDRVAVRSGVTEWTYRELHARADRLAEALLEGVGRAGRIAVLCDHDATMVAALLAVLRTGCAYVPLDPAHPVDRLAAIAADAQVEALIASRRNARTAQTLATGRMPVVVSDPLDGNTSSRAVAFPSVSPDAVAYILYTSGSTGRPKGVVQNHRNLLHHARAYTNGLHIGREDRLSLLASYSFDAAVMDIYGALLNGAALCLFDVRHEGPLALPRWLESEGVTLYHSTPTVYRQAFESMGAPVSRFLRAVVLGGEEVRPRDLETFKRCCPPGCLFVNGLGPTESTLALQYFVDRHTVVRRPTVPVGYPVEQTEVLLLNESDEEVDVYGLGRIVIRSPHVALGYWRRPELTRAAFRPSPLDDRQRLYETGDQGRLLPDGTIEFAGRRDRQIKIRGQRVEIGEVEARLLEHPAVTGAVVTDAPHPTADVALVAYVVFHGGKTASTGELRTFLRERLPEHMVPAAVVPLSAFPLTVTGKVDRRGLPLPDFSLPRPAVLVAPRNDLEATLASLFASVLGLSRIGVADDFFELGGHSLLATQLLARMRSTLHVEVPLRAIFEQPTVAGLARLVGGLTAAKADAAAAIAALPRARAEKRSSVVNINGED